MSVKLFPKVDPSKWARTYNLKVRTSPCSKCGEKQTANIPWATSEYRGLVAPVHKCGKEYQLMTAVPVNKSRREDWVAICNLVTQGEQ